MFNKSRPFVYHKESRDCWLVAKLGRIERQKENNKNPQFKGRVIKKAQEGNFLPLEKVN